MVEVRVRTEDDGKAVRLGEVPLDAKSLDQIVRLIGMWGIRACGDDYGHGDTSGQFVYEDGAAFFEVVLCKDEE